MKTLALECSAKSAGCCVTEDGRLLCENFVNLSLTHSQTLMPMVDSMLNNAQIGIGEIDRFAVAVGPGSFTGLRIGVAAVKGMALAANRPCVAVPTLLAMATGAMDVKNALLCPVMDARREQVYTTLFATDGERLTQVGEDAALSMEELYDRLSKALTKKNTPRHILLIGDGADLCYTYLKDRLPALVAGETLRWQRAAGVALAADHLPDCSPGELNPVYLRLPQAERELKGQDIG